jgi:transposase
MIGDLEEEYAETAPPEPEPEPAPPGIEPESQARRRKPKRKPLPENLPRDVVEHPTACACPKCGGALRRLGEDVTEVLEYVPGSFRVTRHVRPKMSCRCCETITQAPAPSLPINRGLAGPGLLAHVLVGKFCDHLPLYRQAEIFARNGIDLDRSTLADWVGQSAALLRPLIEAVGLHVMAADRIHADDTTVPVLSPGNGKTRTGRPWCYVRDDHSFGGKARRRCCIVTVRIERANIRKSIWRGSRASSRRMVTPATRGCTNKASPKPPAWRMSGGSSSTSTPRRNRLSRTRRCNGSRRCMRSRR